LPTPQFGLNPNGNLLTLITNWGDQSINESIQKIFNSAAEELKKNQNIDQVQTLLKTAAQRANSLIFEEVNKNIWNNVIEITVLLFLSKSFCWVSSSQVTLFHMQRSQKSLVPINIEKLLELKRLSRFQQKAPLPFFGLGLQSSTDFNFGSSEYQESRELLLLNFLQAPLLSEKLQSCKAEDAIEIIAHEFPNSAAWASSVKIKS
jgi:hypothetical protein